jgi:hypothetical protein
MQIENPERDAVSSQDELDAVDPSKDILTCQAESSS